MIDRRGAFVKVAVAGAVPEDDVMAVGGRVGENVDASAIAPAAPVLARRRQAVQVRAVGADRPDGLAVKAVTPLDNPRQHDPVAAERVCR